MLGGCVAAPVRLFLLPTLLLCTVNALAALLLLPSASNAHILPQEELEESPIFRSLLPRATSAQDKEDSLAAEELLSNENVPVELLLLGARLFSPPFTNYFQQRPSSAALSLSRPSILSSSSKQLRPYYVSEVVENPNKRQSNLGVRKMCQIDSRNCAGKRFVGKKFGSSSWPRSLEAKLRRTSYLYEDLDQNANNNRFLQI